MNRAIIAPSILSADFTRLDKAVRRVEEGGADWIHLDVMDGRFVPNITFGPMIVEAVKKLTGIPLDVHLMIVEPDKHIERFRGAGADLITVHYEAAVHLERLIRTIQSTGAKAGVALNPATPEECLKYIIDAVDLVLLMSVNPGFGGQSFISATNTKIVRTAQMRAEAKADFLIAVDGGVDAGNAGELVNLGADVLVTGNAIFTEDDPAAAIEKIRSAAIR